MTEGDAFLREFHAAHPGATSRALSHGVDDDGHSSYDLLAALVKPGDTILDLGCGDGHLLELIHARALDRVHCVGLDMSPAELRAAQHRDESLPLVQARAQLLPVRDTSLDGVASHLAFLLMSNIEQVCAEITRVLRPGGWFATITGGGPENGDAFELFLQLFQRVYEASPRKAPRYGDKRARHGEGIAELFGDAFEAPVESVHSLRLDGPVRRVWATLSVMYEAFVLEDEALAKLHDAFVAAATNIEHDGIVPCAMRMRFVQLRKR